MSRDGVPVGGEVFVPSPCEGLGSAQLAASMAVESAKLTLKVATEHEARSLRLNKSVFIAAALLTVASAATLVGAVVRIVAGGGCG